jgi:hypothetical protein
VPGNNPVRLLLKLPVVTPSLVCESVTEGLCDVLQQVPLAVTADPPLEDIFPPEVAEVREMAVAAVVITVGAMAADVKVRSLP